MILFFDTETNGKPKSYDALVRDVDNWPRVTQLAWILFNEDGTLYDQQCNMIKPDGWAVPKEEFFIRNGHSTERCEREGVPIAHALQWFITPLERCKVIVAHNMAFDFPVIAAEMIRAGIRPSNKPQKFCTMKASTEIVRIRTDRGLKWPKLEEAYRYFFQEDFNGAHDALADVKACARVYFEMRRRELIPA